MLPALPAIGSDLGFPSENSQQWVVTMIMVGMAVGQLFYGPVSDTSGRRPPVFVGLGLFALGCLLSWFAVSMPMMLLGRFLQGFGVAGPRSVSIALIRDMYEGRDMARVMSMIMSVFILTPIAAPLLGQAILMVADWRMIFASFVLLTAVVTAWFALRQPETLAPEDRRPFSWRQLLANARVVLADRAAMGFTLTAGLSSGAFIGYLASSQQIFQDQYHTGSRFAVYFAILAASIGIASQVNGRLVMRLGMVALTTWALRALALLSLGYFAYAWSEGGHPPFGGLMTYLVLSFFCIGILFGNINSLAMESLGRVAGVGAAVVTSGSLAISVALGGSIGQLLDGTVLPLVGGFALLSLVALPVLAWSAAQR
jgi:DHA1 family bicyclomycin/chloramphenicol resistance-like MFS transporter